MPRRDTPEILTLKEAFEKSTLDTLRPLAKLLDRNAPPQEIGHRPVLDPEDG